MGRKKVMKDPQEELEAECKLLIDEATNLMKVHNYTKAMTIYQKVKLQIPVSFPKALFTRANIWLFFSSFKVFCSLGKAYSRKFESMLLFIWQLSYCIVLLL